MSGLRTIGSWHWNADPELFNSSSLFCYSWSCRRRRRRRRPRCSKHHTPAIIVTRNRPFSAVTAIIRHLRRPVEQPNERRQLLSEILTTREGNSDNDQARPAAAITTTTRWRPPSFSTYGRSVDGRNGKLGRRRRHRCRQRQLTVCQEGNIHLSRSATALGNIVARY